MREYFRRGEALSQTEVRYSEDTRDICPGKDTGCVRLKVRLKRGKASLEGDVRLKMITLAFKARNSRGCPMRPCLISSVISLFS